jgi:uncharacterized membrane protein
MKFKTKIQKYAWRITVTIIGVSAVISAATLPYFLNDKVFLGIMLAFIFAIFVTGIVATNEHKYEWRYED